MSRGTIAFGILLALTAAVWPAGAARADGGEIIAGVEAGGIFPRLFHPEIEPFDVHGGTAYGGHLGYGVSDQATLELGFLRAETTADVTNGESIDIAFNEVLTTFAWAISTGTIRPQLLGGLSYQMIRVDDPADDEDAFGFHFGLGLVGVVTPFLHSAFIARFHQYFPEEFDTDTAVTMLMRLEFHY
ncbi:MAG: hypothetical protein M5R36_08670 [Deltaproteobacteria bacterium]|nr:hypothetical protein [Deltaproteobacteria bacterium]